VRIVGVALHIDEFRLRVYKEGNEGNQERLRG